VSAVLLLAIRIILAILLYAFLGLVVYTQLRDMKQQGMLLAARQPPPLSLSSADDEHASANFITRPVVILGREQGCDFQLDDPTVSSQHARLSFRQQQWWLEDLASTNGTYLNGEAVTAPVVIAHGDELRLGHKAIRVEIGQIKNPQVG
jgi:hypothetical protein